MISPLDTRYSHMLKDLEKIFGEKAILQTKFKVEACYLIHIANCMSIPMGDSDKNFLLSVVAMSYDIDMDKYQSIQDETHHDIKAIIVYIQNELSDAKLSSLVHFGLTSEDVVSLSNNMAFGAFYENVYFPLLSDLKSGLCSLMSDNDNYMVARTHGQPAVPTTFNRQLKCYHERISMYHNMPLKKCKFGGAIGTMAPHRHIMGLVDVHDMMDSFVGQFGFFPDRYATQTDYYSYICGSLNQMKLLALAVEDMCTDMWLYSNNKIIKIIKPPKATGSSTMTHKSNPIKFENSIANLRLFIAMVDHFVNNMSKSMLQRDLTSSSLLRNLGVILGHFVVACKNATSGLNNVLFNSEAATRELSNSYQILAEYVQLYLKFNCEMSDSEHAIKEEFTVDTMTKNDYGNVIDQICMMYELEEAHRQEMKSMTVYKYI